MKTKADIIQRIKDFHKGAELIHDGEELGKKANLDGITYEVEMNKPSMVEVICDGEKYRIKAEDLIKEG